MTPNRPDRLQLSQSVIPDAQDSGLGLRASAGPVTPPKAGHAAALWLLDSIGAIGFAACLALFLGTWAGHGQVPYAPLLLLGLVVSGLVRAMAQGAAMIVGQAKATDVKQAQRGSLLRALLPSLMPRAALVGEDMRVAIDDVEAGEGWIARFLPLRRAAVMSPFIIAAAVAVASWFSALILLATLIPFGLGMALAGYAGKGEAERQLAALSRLSGLFVDRVAALPIILAFGAEERVTRQIATAAQEVAYRTIAVLRIAFVSSAVLEFFAALSVALVAMYCGFALLGILPFPAPERLDLTRAFFALAMAPEFYLGMRRMAAAYHDKQQGEASHASIAKAMAEAKRFAPPAPAQYTDAIACLMVEHLSVHYPDGTQTPPVSAQWHGPGLHVLIGETGAGKSSVLHALLGLTPSAAGTISADGARVIGGALQPMVGWSGQRPLLLPASIKENLLLGAQGSDWDAVVPLLKAVQLHSMVERRGVDFAIDARGSGLSGGERRRIGLVRALASGRPLLMLDEPTADLDEATADAIACLLRLEAERRMIIAATHDARLIAMADSITSIGEGEAP